MSEPKVQLLDPQGNISLPGINATGVITASSLDGAGGVVTGLTGNPNLNVGVVTATSFVGDGTGHAANLTGTPNLNLGLTTATSFVGDAVGKAAGLRGTPNLNVGLITATSFSGDVTGNVTGNVSGNLTGNITGDVTGNITGDVAGDITGNVSGLARGLGISGKGVWAGAGTSNVNVGVCTALQYYGDGSGLTGAGSSASIAQEITAVGAETIIDLSDGNLIYYKGASDTTVGFASTSAAEQITLVRDASPTFDAAYNVSYSTGVIDFNGSSQYLTVPTSTDFDFGSGDFTVECWIQGTTNSDAGFVNISNGGAASNSAWILYQYGGKIWFGITEDTSWDHFAGGTISLIDGDWHHIAATREGSSFKMWVDGVYDGGFTYSGSIPTSTRNLEIATQDGSYLYDGKISNVRVIKGTALYTSEFLPSPAPLTNVTNTVLLCCQSTSSTTTAAVIPSGSITATGSPTAAADTIAASGTNTVNNSTSITWPERVKWNGYVTPVLSNTSRSNYSFQVFHFTTADTGATYQAWEQSVSEATYGQVWKVGGNSSGQLGINDRTDRSSPVQIPGGWQMASFVSGGYMGAGVKVGGTAWAWGYNNAGALGQNNRTQYSSPVQLPGTTWSSLALSSTKCYGVKTDNTYWAWGAAYHGALGLNLGGSVRRSSPTQVPGSWSDGGPLTNQASWGLKTDGTFWVWGRNNQGQLGLNEGGPSERISSPAQLPGTGWTNKIACHQQTSQVNALKSNGTLWGWGSCGSGALGLNDAHSLQRSSPTQVGTDSNWKDLVTTKYGGLATKTDGTIWGWGGNQEGELGQNGGDSGQERYSSPVQIGTDTTWNIPLTNGEGASMALKTDGTLWSWGKNNDGALGLNNSRQANNARYSSPTQVPGTYLAGDVRGFINAGVSSPIIMRP